MEQHVTTIKPSSIENLPARRPTIPAFPARLRDFEGWGPRLRY